ncbi:MFS transporter [Paenibacillus sp. 1P07SE]|uniref:MFS transporter n=1 Tax=Paenibacillus sp. 1P07SE TaxID=3132209 RepID=UPI0039A777B7
MPYAIYVLGLTIFAMTTSEFMVAGMMPSLSEEFGVSIPAIGYLISAYAAGMVVGGPLITLGLLKVTYKKALLTLITAFFAGQVLGALATSYEMMFAARVITGVASSACFGVSIAIAVNLAGAEFRGRAVSVVLGGLMISKVVGLPMAIFIDQQFGWRITFWLVAVLVLFAGLVVQKIIPSPSLSNTTSISLKKELNVFKNRKLWAAFTTSTLIIGATFAAFSYLTPILTEITGFDSAVVPFLLAFYGAATVVGNIVVGRFADRYTIPILWYGLITLTVCLVIFTIFSQNAIITILMLVVLGLVGVPMNPAMAARVMKAANDGSLVNSVHSSVITFGVVIGSSIGGLTISMGYGLISPLWVGAILGTLGVISLVPLVSTKSYRQV